MVPITSITRTKGIPGPDTSTAACAPRNAVCGLLDLVRSGTVIREIGERFFVAIVHQERGPNHLEASRAAERSGVPSEGSPAMPSVRPPKTNARDAAR